MITHRNTREARLERAPLHGFRSWIAGAIVALHLPYAATGATLFVTSLNDAGPGTLRDRVAQANDGDWIRFSVIGSITLESTIEVNKRIGIAGPSAKLLTIQSQDVDPGLFTMYFDGPEGGLPGEPKTPTFRGMRLVNPGGYALVSGQELGKMRIERCSLESNNYAVMATYLEIWNSYIGGNRYGVGVVSDLEMVNCTVSGNTSQAVSAGRSLMILNSTIVNNAVNAEFGAGGGVHSSGQSLNLYNTIIAGNGEYDLKVESTDGLSSVGNLLASISPPEAEDALDPTDTLGLTLAQVNLAPLAYNGGGTFNHHPNPGSPAIDGGINGVLPSSDQRGYARVAGPAVDVGPVEYGSHFNGYLTRLTASGIQILGKPGILARLEIKHQALEERGLTAVWEVDGRTEKVEFVEAAKGAGSLELVFRLPVPPGRHAVSTLVTDGNAHEVARASVTISGISSPR